MKLECVARTTRDASVLRHVLIVLWMASGADVDEIATLLSVTRRDVYLWLARFKAEGMSVVLGRRQENGGRPNALDDDAQELVSALLSHHPDQLGYSVSNWTIPLLRTHMTRWFGEQISKTTLRRHLHKLGYVWKRPRYVLDPDPKRKEKMSEIRVKVANSKPHTAILFADETDLLLFPPIRSAWAERGQSIKISLHGQNEKRVIFGAINVRTGTRLFLSRDRHRAEDFQFFLKLIRWHYRRWPVLLILDLDNSHVAQKSQILARGLEIELAWLPKRSPELNPIESLWGKGKDIVCANRQYEDLDDQVDQFITYLQDLSSQEALRKSGALSTSFWLWKK